MSAVCPFCKRAVPVPGGACPSCGKAPPGAAAGPSLDDDDPFDGGLDFSRNQAAGQSGSSAYSGGGGMSFGDDDDPFADDVPGGSLELDLPPSHAARSARSIPAAAGREPPPDREIVPPPTSAGERSDVSRSNVSGGPLSGSAKAAAPMGPTSSSLRAAPNVSHAPGPESAPAQPRSADPAELIARYPAAPDKVWEAPAYAVRVLLRQLELRQDLASLRKRRSPDVALYERALTVHDKKAFARGILIVGAGLAIATVLFFLPVILRFTQAPD